MSSAAVLALFTLLTLLLVTPAAAAAGAAGVSPKMVPAGPAEEPIALAATGLDITVPIIIGITTLVLGIAFVAWAFLRKGSSEQHR